MKIIKIISIAAGAIAAATIAGLAIANPGNVAETSVDAKDENLRPRLYKTDLESFVAETQKIIPTLSTYGQNWKFIGAGSSGSGEIGKPQIGTATLLVEVPVVFFTDDLEINAYYDGEKGETLVNIHSASRVGHTDFGENRRRISQILRALDEKFGQKN